MRACMREWWLRKVVLKSAEDVRVWMCVCVRACYNGGWVATRCAFLPLISSSSASHIARSDRADWPGRTSMNESKGGPLSSVKYGALDDVNLVLNDASVPTYTDSGNGKPHDGGEGGGVIVPSRLTTGIFNLTNTILGMGTLAMPYAAMNAGAVFFPILVVITGFAANYAVSCLFSTVEMLHIERPRYPSLGKATMGRCGMLTSSWAVTFQQFGACVSYVIIIADVLFPVISRVEISWLPLCDRWFLQVFLVVTVIFPLCLVTRISSLKYASMLSLGLIGITAMVVTGNGLYVVTNPQARNSLLNNTEDHAKSYCQVQASKNTKLLTFDDVPTLTLGGAIDLFPRGPTFLTALPILAFSFLCHHNTFPIYRELERATVRRMSMVSRRSMMIAALTYASTGVFGYVTFLSDTEDDVLKNFKFEGTYISWLMNIVRVGFGLSMVLSFPLMIWEVRHNLNELLFGGSDLVFGYRFVIFNIVLLILTTTIAIAAPGVGPVIELIGSTCSPLMVYILPALFFLHAKPGKMLRRENLAPLTLLTVGVVMIPVCLFMWGMKYLVCFKGSPPSDLCDSIFG